MAPEFQAYVGPRPFEQKDKAIFFGRDSEARDLLSIVIADPFKSILLAIESFRIIRTSDADQLIRQGLLYSYLIVLWF